uniref:Coiled-coil-helix-coiled-coil-helix domain containing 3 n=1 Tax=Canis lupus familiaris TaxID=9615 RepID=A0A8C0Q7M3_CANLF
TPRAPGPGLCGGRSRSHGRGRQHPPGHLRGGREREHHRGEGHPVSDEELKRRVAEELALEQARKESENQKRLKQGKELDRERAFANEQLTRAILRERISSEEERAKAKHLAKQLEEKDRVIKKQDAFYKEQLARLEERSSEFYKVTTEQYQKAVEDVEAKFKRYEFHPVCADLQAKILQCYRQNTQQTLSCSALANQYMHCVNQAKQVETPILKPVMLCLYNALNWALNLLEASSLVVVSFQQSSSF